MNICRTESLYNLYPLSRCFAANGDALTPLDVFITTWCFIARANFWSILPTSPVCNEYPNKSNDWNNEADHHVYRFISHMNNLHSSTCLHQNMASLIYTAWLRAIDVDTTAQQSYLAMLATRLKITMAIASDRWSYIGRFDKGIVWRDRAVILIFCFLFYNHSVRV